MQIIDYNGDRECRRSHAGVEPSLDLAVLLQLPETDLREFEAGLSLSHLHCIAS